MPRTRDEALEDAKLAMDRFDRAIGETVALLDGWLVTLSSAALAAPSVFSSDFRLESLAEWRFLAWSYLFLGLTITTILARRLIHNARVGHHAMIVKLLGDATRDNVVEHSTEYAAVTREVEKIQVGATKLARAESHLRWIPVVLFVVGMVLMGSLSLVKARPAGGCGRAPAAVAVPRTM